jgi:hypothetical protein
MCIATSFPRRFAFFIAVGGLFAQLAALAGAQDATETAPGPAEATPAVPTPAEVAARALPNPSSVRSIEQERATRLGVAIRNLADLDKGARTWGGIGAVVLGGVSIAAGVFVAVEQNSAWGNGTGRAALSGALIGSGASSVAAAIYRWIAASPAENRLTRWNDAQHSGGLGPFELGRFEGELVAESDLAHSLRYVSAASAIGVFAGGATLLSFSAADAFEGKSARTAGYTIGGIVSAIAAIQATLLLLIDSPAEHVWRTYTRDLSPQLELPLR